MDHTVTFSCTVEITMLEYYLEKKIECLQKYIAYQTMFLDSGSSSEVEECYRKIERYNSMSLETLGIFLIDELVYSYREGECDCD